MRELNIEFQEQYKRLDKLCREMYHSVEGVSSYIKDMEYTSYSEQKAVYDWDIVFKKLKHYRWMRNQLAHEMDIDTEFCEKADIDWIKQFYERILKGNDPLAIAYKTKAKPAPQITHTEPLSLVYAEKEKPRKSLWKRITSKIRSLFS